MKLEKGRTVVIGARTYSKEIPDELAKKWKVKPLPVKKKPVVEEAPAPAEEPAPAPAPKAKKK